MAENTTQADDKLADDILKRHSALLSERAVWESSWQEIGEFFRPIRAYINREVLTPDASDYAKLYDSTGRQANIVLAGGQFSSVTPLTERWFVYGPPLHLREDETVRKWFNQVTEITHEILAHSNFYTEIHEFYLDRGAFGTANLYVEEGDDHPVFFKTCEIGSYAVAENRERRVDTCFREYEMTARQAAQEFGVENLSEMTRKLLDDPAKQDDKIAIVHAVYPRMERDLKKQTPDAKRYASIHIEKKAKRVVRNSGYDDMPFMISRFSRWGDSAYGWGPGWVALPDMRQLNYLQKNLDSLAEIAAFPRLLFPDMMDNTGSDVDLRAGGVTYFDATNPNAVPREWATQGRYDMGMDRAKMRMEAINQAFYVDLFRMFQGLDKHQMTAREVAERASEKLTQFVPIFSRMTTEVFSPLLRRVFTLLALQGAYGQPPAQLADDEGMIFEPEMSYTSRMAMAIQALKSVAWSRTLENALPLLNADPGVLNNFNLHAIIRDTARADGLPEEWIRTPEEVAAIQQAQQEAQQAMQQAEIAQKMADAGQKVGTMPKEMRRKVMEAA